MSSTYTVKQGMSLWDVVLNATGSLANLDAVCAANNFTDWTPDLIPGTVVIIPDGVTVDSNSQRQLSSYQAVNNITAGISNLINAIFNTLNDTWILVTGYWQDKYLWKDNKNWND